MVPVIQDAYGVSYLYHKIYNSLILSMGYLRGRKLYLHINKPTATGLVAVGLYLKVGKPRYPLSQRQLNDIINVSGDGVEVEGDAVASLCEVDTLVGAKDGGGLDFVVASRDEEAGVHTV